MHRLLQQRPPSREAPIAQSRGSRVRSVPLNVLVLATIFAVTGIAYFVLRNSAWVYDDNLILVLARNWGFNHYWLDHPIFQHWDPAMNATYSVLVHLFPLDYRWALVTMLAAVGASMFLFERIIGMVIGRGWISLALAAWFGLSISVVRDLQWWASGIQGIPSLLFDLICLYAFLRYFSDRRDRWIVVSVAALAIGLLFYEKPALMLVYLALTRVLLMSQRLAPRSIASTFLRERRLWLSYCAVVVLWGIGYLTSGALGSGRNPPVSAIRYLDFFHVMWFDALTPALFGFTIPATGESALQILAIVALQVCFLALLVISVRRKPSAWRAWAFIFIAVVLEGLVIAHARAGIFGAAIADDIRYLTDFPWLIAFALCCAFSRDTVLHPRQLQRGPRVQLRIPRRAVPVLIAAVLVAYSAAAIATAARLQSEWPGTPARHWESNVQSAFAAIGGRHMHPVVADNLVPDEIIASPFAPYNRLSSVLPLYVDGVHVDGPLDGPLVALDGEGHVHPAAIAATLPTTSFREVGPGAVIPSHRASAAICGQTRSTRLQIEGRFRSGSIGPAPYYLELRYWTRARLALRAYEDTGQGYSPAYTIVGVGPSAHTSLAFLAPPLPRRIELVGPPHAPLCIEQMNIVTLSAGAQSGLGPPQ